MSEENIMSNIKNYLISIQEIVDPMVYQGCNDSTIVEYVQKYIPEASKSDILNIISRARFDYCEFGSYYA
jgi:hypothetical protein